MYKNESKVNIYHRQLKAKYLGLIGFDQDFTNLEVQHLIIPSTGQYVIAHTCQRITHKEISITQNQSLRHLDEKKELAS